MRELAAGLSLTLLFQAFTMAAAAAPAKYPVTGPDGVVWQFPASSRTVAIGDLHGDYQAFVTILLGMNLIDTQLQWRGGDAQLILMGDLNDRGDSTRRILDYLSVLSQQAKAAGGAVHTLMGNHEIMTLQGQTHYVSDSDIFAFREFLTPRQRKLVEDLAANNLPFDVPNRNHLGLAVTHAFRGPSTYANELGQRNTILKVGDTLFVHAGLEDWAGQLDPAAINATVRQWVAFFQARAARPPLETAWVLGFSGHAPNYDPHKMAQGPLWTAVFSLDPGENRGWKLPKLERWLKNWGVNRVVTGHIHALSGIAPIPHPMYGDLVYMIDTGNSGGYSGAPDTVSALEISNGKAEMHYIPRRIPLSLCEKILKNN